MDFIKQFTVTHDMKIEFKNVQLNANIIISTFTPCGKQSICMDIDKWTEFKKSIFDIDKEFYKRVNYQYQDLNEIQN